MSIISALSKWIAAVLFLILSLPAYAASRYTVVTEIVPEGKKPRSEVVVVTLAGDKGRIDIIERNGLKEKGGLYLMTLDGGKTAVLGHQQKSVCSEWDSEAYFREMGQILHAVKRWTNLKITDVNVEKVLEESGPELLGYTTKHVRLKTTAGVKASVLIKKFRYSLEITDDIWIAPQLELHPIEQQWIAAQTNTGFKQLDQMLDSWNKQLPATILKHEAVVRLKDLLNKEESTKTEKIEITKIEKLNPSKIPEETFRMPNCEKVSKKKMKEAAKDILKDVVE